MNLNDLSKTIELAHVNNEFGFGQTITYTHRRTNTTTPPLKAFCQDGTSLKLSDDIVGDIMSFLSVELVTRPERGDSLSFNGDVWIVETFVGTNPYDIVCYSNSRHQNSRSQRKTI